MDAKTALVFDVESVGLHGEGFAYGAVLVELNSGRFLEEHRVSCEPQLYMGTRESFNWVEQHVVPALRATAAQQGPHTQVSSPALVRHDFWSLWRRATESGALLVADTAWPVEARFLARCVDDGWSCGPAVGLSPYVKRGSEKNNPRYWQGPYPLIDAAAIFALVDVSDVQREATRGELPAHDPLCDARHSARQLLAARAYAHFATTRRIA